MKNTYLKRDINGIEALFYLSFINSINRKVLYMLKFYSEKLIINLHYTSQAPDVINFFCNQKYIPNVGNNIFNTRKIDNVRCLCYTNEEFNVFYNTEWAL